MRRWMKVGLGLVVAVASAQAWGADAAPVADDLSQDFVRSQATGKRCERKLPGLALQLVDARGQWLSRLDAAQLQAAQAYAASKDGKKLAKAADTEAALAFRNPFSAAQTCIVLINELDPGRYPTLAGTAMPADKAKWELDNFAPMVLASLECARLDAIEVAPAANGAETWTYRGCGRTETVGMVPQGRSLSMDGASADRTFAAMFD